MKNFSSKIFILLVLPMVVLFGYTHTVSAAVTTIINTTDAPVQGQNANLDALGDRFLAQSFITDDTGGVLDSIVIQDAYVKPVTDWS